MSRFGSAAKAGAKEYKRASKEQLHHPSTVLHASQWPGVRGAKAARSAYSHPQAATFHSAKDMSGAHNF